MNKRVLFGGIVVVLSVVALFFHVRTPDVRADGTHTLSIFVDGEHKTIASASNTVGEALEASGIALYEHDKTEPTADSPITTNDFKVNIYRARPITVVDEPNIYTITTAERTPRAIAEMAGFKPEPEDGFVYQRSDETLEGAPGTKLIIKRSKEITFELYGVSSKLRTREVSVSDLLLSKNITLEKEDELNVPLETKVTSGMKVSIARIGKEVKTVEEDIKFPEEQIQDVNQPVSYRLVKKEGVNGRKLVTYQITIRNGKEYKKKSLKEVITKEPVKQVVVVGAKNIEFSGDFASALARLRSCEGAYTSNTGNGYYGAYQYDLGTWGNYRGYPNAAAAPPAVQDQKAWETYKARGWQPWPSCSISQGLQDIYR